MNLVKTMRSINAFHASALKKLEEMPCETISSSVKDVISKQRDFLKKFNSLAGTLQYKKAHDHLVSFFKQNFDYDEGWSVMLDKFREEMKEELVTELKDKRSELQDDWMFLNSFCKSKRNLEYWNKLKGKNKDKSKAVEDFIKYISTMEC